jgi:hypothetical protein
MISRSQMLSYGEKNLKSNLALEKTLIDFLFNTIESKVKQS